MDYLSILADGSKESQDCLQQQRDAFSQHCSQLQRSSDCCVRSHRENKWVPYEDGKKGPTQTGREADRPKHRSLRKRPFLSVWMEVPFNLDAYILNLIKPLLWPISNKSWWLILTLRLWTGWEEVTGAFLKPRKVSLRCPEYPKKVFSQENNKWPSLNPRHPLDTNPVSQEGV